VANRLTPFRFAQAIGSHPLTTLQPDIGGYYYRVRPGLVTIPIIISTMRERGRVSEFLNRLPTDERIEFRSVLHLGLRKALHRRGFRRVAIPIPDCGDVDDCAYVRNPKKRK
jgi:hypothetical protein